MVGESLDVLTKRVLVENTLAVSGVKTPGENTAPLTPAADAHGRKAKFSFVKNHCIYY